MEGNLSKRIYDSKVPMEIIIDNKYKFVSSSIIGHGAYGQIYKGVNIDSNEDVAIKVETHWIPDPNLLNEVQFLQLLQGEVGFPIIYLSTSIENSCVLVMEYLGQNLAQLLKEQPKKAFSYKTSIMIGIQLLDRLKYVHERNIIHRDIKLENVTIGSGSKSNVLYLIDYSISEKYKDSNTGKHLLQTHNFFKAGSLVFSSINAFKGFKQTRRDDLESLGYLIVYCFQGYLRWSDRRGKNNKERNKYILYEKQNFAQSFELLQELDAEIKKYFKYVYSLKYEDTPDYDYLKELLIQGLEKKDIKNDCVFDWSKSEENLGSNQTTDIINNNTNENGNNE